jgi:hypothetical protein
VQYLDEIVNQIPRLTALYVEFKGTNIPGYEDLDIVSDLKALRRRTTQSRVGIPVKEIVLTHDDGGGTFDTIVCKYTVRGHDRGYIVKTLLPYSEPRVFD